jgi:hypothetical protein
MLIVSKQDTANALMIYTPSSGVDTERLRIGNGATATATWNAITHTGMVMGGEVNFDGYNLANAANLIGNDGADLGIYSTGTQSVERHIKFYTSNDAINKERLDISAGATATATWSDTNVVFDDWIYLTDDNGEGIRHQSTSNYFGIFTNRTDDTTDGIIFFSKNAGGTDTVRLKIGTGADTVSITSGAAHWHFDSNIVYAHDIRNNDNNPIIIRGNSQSGNGFIIHTSGDSPGFADTARLTISSAVETATATWSDITHTGFVSSEITMANEWRLMESELYNDYPKGFAIGHSSKWDIGDTIWVSDNKEELMKDEVPVFAVTDEWLEFRGHRYTPQDYEKRISELEKKLAELSGDE